MREKLIIISIGLFLSITEYENTNIWLATEAGIDAVTTITLSDEWSRSWQEVPQPI